MDEDGQEPQYDDEEDDSFANGNSQHKYSDDSQPTDGDAPMTEKKGGGADDTLEAIKARVREMEEEAEKLKLLQSEVDRQMNTSSSSSLVSSATGAAPPNSLSLEEKVEVDARSVYVGNVDYGATAEEVEQHFHGCGSINRVTILCNKFDGHPKGVAYIEFTDRESVNTAMAMDESLFRGRLIKVMPKRTNRPGMAERRGRGRGLSRGGFGFRGRGGFYRGHARFPRRGFRSRSAYFSPY